MLKKNHNNHKNSHTPTYIFPTCSTYDKNLNTDYPQTSQQSKKLPTEQLQTYTFKITHQPKNNLHKPNLIPKQPQISHSHKKNKQSLSPIQHYKFSYDISSKINPKHETKSTHRQSPCITPIPIFSPTHVKKTTTSITPFSVLEDYILLMVYLDNAHIGKRSKLVQVDNSGKTIITI